MAGQSAPAITAGLLQKVRAFAGSAPQSDDIAILTLKIGGGSVGKGRPRMTLELHATPEEVMRAVEALQEFGAGAGRFPRNNFSASRSRWRNAAATSSTTRCNATREQTFRVTFEHTGSAMVIELRDRGPEFDPTLAPGRRRKPTTTTGRPAAGGFISSAATWMRFTTPAKAAKTCCA